MMHAAPLTSTRLQRVLNLLKGGVPKTKRQIVRGARVMAVNACISELRHHGAVISCRCEIVNGQRRFYYQMTKAPE